ncbi:hypothetical protein HZC53_05535 [Candidatus Uhrbacteria bacterium]|nr:hypothetical protein [Candidatus Uhrbacteria bacterium]
MDEKLKDLLAGLVITGIFTITKIIPLPVVILAQFLTFFAVLFPAYILGKRFCPKSRWMSGTALGLITYATVVALVQTAWFYLNGTLGIETDIWTMIAAMGICHTLAAFMPEPQDDEGPEPLIFDSKRILRGILLLACSSAALYFVLQGASSASTSDSIRTPWPLLPPGTLLAVALGWLAVIVSAWVVKSRALTAIQTALAIFATTAIVPLVYRIGFGFDGFLHIASEKIILETGTLSPKPLYYMGQYVFTTWLHRLLDLPLDQVDRWLVPFGAAILLALAVYLGRRKSDAVLLPATLLLLPLAPFIATTPQSFAYLLGLAAVILVRGRFDGYVSPIPGIILAAWSVAVHPLAGVPFFLVVLALSFWPKKNMRLFRTRQILAWLTVVGSACAVPAMFYVLGLRGGTQINWDLNALFNSQPWLELGKNLLPWIGNHFALWPSWSSLIAHSVSAILLLASVGSVFAAKDDERGHAILLMVSAFLFILASTVLKATGEFAFLIEYERSSYADRLWIMANMLLAAAALPALSKILGRVRRGPPLLGTALLTLLLAASAALTYDALPRNDALVTGRGWSVGQADLEAVRTIDRDAERQPYTVLANQSVSAAAVVQFGFKRYHDQIFYYPIPTSGPLYDLYLRMTYKEPTRDTVSDAGALGGTKLVYVVLNDYWWNAINTAETLSIIADGEWTIGDTTKNPGHSLKVYKFDLSKPARTPATIPGS